MNTPSEVDFSAAAAGTAATRERDQAKDLSEGKPRRQAPDDDECVDRVSIDPLRATDRYRLVAPLDLGF